MLGSVSTLEPEQVLSDDEAMMHSAVTLGDQDDAAVARPRHGALLQPEADDWELLESAYMTHWSNKRHKTNGDPIVRRTADLPDWRMRERLRTVTAALVMCLNIGVDPPDVSKTNPCSKLICWMDPESLDASKALPAIGRNLQVQFETLSMKTRYKQYLDPIVEETKRFCTNLRRTAKDERVLFYYNGYGVPKPTPGGEIWVFNKAYTQYIPLTLYDLQTWLGNPCIYVWDTSASGHIVNNFRRLAEARAEDEVKQALAEGREPPPMPNADGIMTDAAGEQHFPLRESIHLAACGADEVLPMNPDLPADLFTCCLTSPIEISLRWFVLQNPLPNQLNVDMVMNIPGRLQDRRTPLGELNWILTAVTDTIAWTVLPRALFRRFFRDDLMVAALLRNYLLAERIMRFYHCTPVSHPRLPATHNHPLWDSWDLAVDQCLAQLPTLLAKEQARVEAENGGPPMPPHLAAFEYKHSTFFSEQLKAFEVWLSQGDVSRRPPRRRVRRHPVVRVGGEMLGITPFTSTAPHNVHAHEGTASSAHRQGSIDAAPGADGDEEDEAALLHDPPQQLPIVLQVLLSQVHRLRALILLSQFLDLGPWAVNLALSIGIFPYVLKLLQSPAVDLKPVLIYIWARILAVDHSCQVDLLRDNGYMYFASVLSPVLSPFQSGGGVGSGSQWASTSSQSLPIPNVSEHRAMCAFILAVFCQDFPMGQDACLETDIMDACLEHLEDDDFLLRQWSALCLAQLWNNSDLGKARAIAKDAHGKLCCLLSDASPEVRAAMLYALGVLLGASGSAYEVIEGAGERRKDQPRHTPRGQCVGTGSMTDLPPARQRNVEIGIAVAILASAGDCSPLVRKELVIALSALVHHYHGFFMLAAYLHNARERAATRLATPTLSRMSADVESRVEYEEQLLSSVVRRVLERDECLDPSDVANIPAFVTLFVALLDLSVDPHPEVESMASTVVDRILAGLLEQGVLHADGSVFCHVSLEQLEQQQTVPTALATHVERTPPSTPPEPGMRESALARTMRALSALTTTPPPPPPSKLSSATALTAVPRLGEDTTSSGYEAPYTQGPREGARSATVDSLAAYAPSRPRHGVRIEDVLADALAADLQHLRLRGRDDGTPPGWYGRLRETLPLQSRLFAWCSEYYTEPQMKSAEADEPGSQQFNRHAWRRKRCERHIAEAMETAGDAGTTRWSKRIGSLAMPSAPSMVLFHEYDPYMVSASNGDRIAVWDWEEQRMVSSFSNGNTHGTDITSMTFINEEVDTLLLVGSADAHVRLYRQYEHAPGTRHGVELVSAFRALPDLLRSRYPSGLRVAWQQVSGRLLAGGDCRLIRLWDAHRELCIADVPTHVNSCVTSITSDTDIGHLFMAGFGDGSIGVYDQRNPPASSLVRLWEEHVAWVEHVHLQKHGQRELASASVDGEIRLWDIRARSSIVQKRLPTDGTALSAMAVHDRMPVLAATSAPHSLHSTLSHTTWLCRLQDLSPLGSPYVHTHHHTTSLASSALRPIRDRDPLPSRYSPSTSVVAFHPHYPVMAFGGPDHIIDLYRY